MFARRTRGLFELCMALLCVWAAYWHTPVGALLRSAVARVFGVRSSARPLLAYYSGTSSPHEGDGVLVPPELPNLPRELLLTPELAMGVGLHASLRELPSAQRRNAFALARAQGIRPEALLDEVQGPKISAELIRKAAAQLGNEDAAVLAVFAGREPARYALDRARAEGTAAPTIEQLVRHLPPGFDAEVAQASDALAFGVAYGLSWPVPERTPVTSPFGNRLHPVLGMQKQHTGIDLSLPIGTPVRVTADGVVVRASEDGVNGRILVVDHGRGVTTAYLHNQQLLVREGDVLRRGAVIALSGNSGQSTGPHLHYQLELAGHPIDPLAFHLNHAHPVAGAVAP